MYNILLYVIFNLSDHLNYQTVMPSVGASGSEENGQKEKWQ
jgi:hypothetical protein